MKFAHSKLAIMTVAIGLLVGSSEAMSADLSGCFITSKQVVDEKKQRFLTSNFDTPTDKISLRNQPAPGQFYANQLFNMTKQGKTDATYGTLWNFQEAYGNGYCIYASKRTEGTALSMNPCGANTTWWIKNIGNGYYKITNPDNLPQAWDIVSKSTAIGAWVQLWGWADGKGNKQFYINCANNKSP